MIPTLVNLIIMDNNIQRMFAIRDVKGIAFTLSDPQKGVNI